MKALLDVNVIVDVLARRQPFFTDSFAVLQLASQRRFDGFIAAGSVADIDYILRRNGLNRAQARSALVNLTQILAVEDTTGRDIAEAFLQLTSDLEDAVLMASAQRVKADAIITRDQTDFIQSPVPALSPAEFLRDLKGGGADR